MGQTDPRALDSHFAFGSNWQSFVSTVDAGRIAQAERSMARLFPGDELRGKSFLDIGCGSGLSMLAAKRLGAASVHGIDLDPRSVDATRRLLSQHLADGEWSAQEGSAFDLRSLPGTYDVVHSWGVLHHTGDMWTAVGNAAGLVRPGGMLAIALYRKTPLCGLWTIEKRIYKSASPAVQASFRAVYRAAYFAGLLATGRSPRQYLRSYQTERGMDWSHDVHDWMGGYPYESVTPEQVKHRLQALGLSMVRSFEKPAAALGLFGSHCDEFVAVRPA